MHMSSLVKEKKNMHMSPYYVHNADTLPRLFALSYEHKHYSAVIKSNCIGLNGQKHAITLMGFK